MEKRTIIAFLLIFVIWIVFTQFLWKPQQQPQTEQQPQQTAAQQPQTPAAQQNAPVAVDPNASANLSVPAIEEKEILLANEVIELTFSNRGGVITQAVLPEYTGADRESQAALLPEGTSIMGGNLYAPDGLIITENLMWRDSRYESPDGQTIEFRLELADGRALVKRYTLGDSYNVNLDIFGDPFPGVSGYSLLMRSGLNETEEYDKFRSRDWKGRARVNREVETVALQQLEKLGTGRVYPMSGDVDWAGVRSKYFGMMLVPDVSADVSHVEFDDRNDSPAMYVRASNNRAELAHSYGLYIGPLRYKLIQDLYPASGAEEMAEMGSKLLRPISRFFLMVLRGIKSVVGNYGLAVIVFALFLKILLYPLTHKSFESASRMQKIQPQVQEVQRKFRNDPRQMNAEMNKLYKENGVNPFGGCLPLLLQMPFLFALYPILRYSIELRQEPFFLWIQDLSAPDPFYIIPILMGVAMLVQQQFMTPKPNTDNMDERQKAQVQSTRMMGYFMPVIMFVLFMNYPSGLVLYWFVYNLLSIGQQYIIRRRLA